jgi:hypothetical protein
MRPPWSYGVDGADTPDRKRRSLEGRITHTRWPPRAREAGRRDAARPARSAWSVQRQLAARIDGEVAGGATMELGRSERTTMRPLWSYGVDGADTPDRKPR